MAVGRSVASVAHIERAILVVRGYRVVLDSDLAQLYDVATLRSQNATLDVGRGRHRKYLPRVFTEHGALMAASVLNTPRAVQMSIFVVRAFVRFRDWLAGHAELAGKLAELERRVAGHDADVKAIVQAIRQLTQLPAAPRRRIGFRGADPR